MVNPYPDRVEILEVGEFLGVAPDRGVIGREADGLLLSFEHDARVDPPE